MMLNPILEREVKSKMRTWRTPIAIIVYLFFIGLITYTGFTMYSSFSFDGFDPKAAGGIFDFITAFQMGLIMFIVPLVTASSISGERERQTLDLMLCTDIPVMKIIYGKMFSGLSTVMLLVIMASPFLSISFILGGIGILDVFQILLYYAVSALYISSIAIYASTKFKKSITSIIMTYVIMGVLYVTPFIVFIGLGFNYGDFFEPLLSRESYLVTSIFFGPNPGYGLVSLLSFGREITGPLKSQILPILAEVPTWIVSIIWFVIISFIMLKLAKRNLETKEY